MAKFCLWFDAHDEPKEFFADEMAISPSGTLSLMVGGRVVWAFADGQWQACGRANDDASTDPFGAATRELAS